MKINDMINNNSDKPDDKNNYENEQMNNNDNFKNDPRIMGRLKKIFNRFKETDKFVNTVKAGIKRLLKKIKEYSICFLVLLVFVIGGIAMFVEDENTSGGGELLAAKNSTDGQASSTDIKSGVWNLNEEQIKSFIENYDTDNIALKEEMLNSIYLIKKWQDDYGYSAAFFITVAFEEDIQAENFEDFLADMDQKAKEWNENGYTTIQQIAEDYVGDETANEWSNNITNKMNETAEKAEIIKVGVEDTSASDDGYDGTYTSKSGRTYRNYKQTKGPYKNYEWVSGENNTINNNGCALTSAAIVISGYTTPKNPKEIVLEINGGAFSSAPDPRTYLTYYGISCSRPYYHQYTELSEEKKQQIIDNLINDKPVIIYVRADQGSLYTNKEHWMALLDYNQMTNEIYVSNPSDHGGTGWQNKDKLLRGCTEYISIDSK